MKYVVLCIVVFVVLILPACAHAGPDYETRQGFDVYLGGESGPSEDDVTAAIDFAIEVIIANGIYTRAEMNSAMRSMADKTSIRVRAIEADMGFWCGSSSPTSYCWGRHWPLEKLIEIVNQPCIANTALVHEILHWAHWEVGGVIDHEHLDVRMFVSACRQLPRDDHRACVLHTSERLANVALCVSRCGEGCLLTE